MIDKSKGWYNLFQRYWIKLRLLLINDPIKRGDYLRKKKIFYHIGRQVRYKSKILPAEPFLVAIHNNVSIAADVRLITHSLTSAIFNNYTKTKDFYSQFGKIEIHDNVFIGAGATIMYGVTIEENCIIAAGAIVTKNVPKGSVVGGVPAKIIGNFDDQ